jgi:hypothetical protein
MHTAHKTNNEGYLCLDCLFTWRSASSSLIRAIIVSTSCVSAKLKSTLESDPGSGSGSEGAAAAAAASACLRCFCRFFFARFAAACFSCWASRERGAAQSEQ